jgi:hypothetical protein
MPRIKTLDKSTRYTYRTANGRRCQAPFAPNHTALCAQHALQELQLHDSKVVTEEILGPLGDFRSAFAVNRALGKLFTITAENRIPVRNALALAYIGQLLIQTIHSIRNEIGRDAINAMVCDTVVRLDDELPQVPPFCRAEDSKPPMKALVKESLAILRDAGFTLPPDLVLKVKAYRAGQEDDEDDGDNDDDSGDNNSVENESSKGGATHDTNAQIKSNASACSRPLRSNSFTMP